MVDNKNSTKFFMKPKFIQCKGRLLNMTQKLVMGVLNLTPDSFYDGGKYTSTENTGIKVENMIAEGADIIDIGAYSSRPGAVHISAEEELKRLTPALNTIRKRFSNVVISVDTFRASVAKKVVTDFEVDIINDISGGTIDEQMFETIADLHVPYILMHIQGTPQTMQNNPQYSDLVREILLFMARQTDKLRSMGVKDVIIDPGFGFGKTIEHNYELLSRLQEFQIADYPLLVGLSRKSMIYKLLNIKPDDALFGTIALNTLAIQKGADILRVHDVAAAKQVIKLMELVNKNT